MDETRFDDLTRVLSSGTTRRGITRLLGGLTLGGLVAGDALPADAKKGDKVTICHRTKSGKKPFKVIKVAPRAVPAHEKHGDLVACPDGGVIDFDTCTCNCPVVTCPPGEVQNPQTCECECAPVTCPAGQQQDPDTCQCACRPVTCPPGQEQDPDTCECECPAGEVACPGPQGGCCTSLDDCCRGACCAEDFSCCRASGVNVCCGPSSEVVCTRFGCEPVPPTP